MEEFRSLHLLSLSHGNKKQVIVLMNLIVSFIVISMRHATAENVVQEMRLLKEKARLLVFIMTR